MASKRGHRWTVRALEGFALGPPGHPEGYVSYADRLLIPARFKCEATAGGFPARVLLDVAVIDGLTVLRRVTVEGLEENGPAVTGEILRQVPIARLLRESIKSVAFVQFRAPDGREVYAISGSEDAALFDQIASANRRRRSVWRIDDEFLQEVARVYSEAATQLGPRGLPEPTKAVATHLRGAHSSAARWVSLARQKGFLPPVPRRSQKEE